MGANVNPGVILGWQLKIRKGAPDEHILSNI
jgi:hypothetical protein